MTDTTSTAGFVHLHVHTEFSVLDGMTNIADACVKVAADGQKALAVTDHGNLGGAWQLNREAKKAGIKPLIGAEVYLAVMSDWRDEPNRMEKQNVSVPRDDESAVDDDVAERGGTQSSAMKLKKYEHLTLFATSPIGWKNLASMMDIAEETGFHAKPRIDYALLKEYSEGILVLTGCLGGPVLGPVSRGAMDQARMNLDRIIDAVGKDNVFVEIMEHGIPVESAALPAMVKLAEEYRLPIVATNDSHYTNEDDHEAHEAWLAVQSGKSLTDPKRFHFHGRGYHLRSETEMRSLRPESWWQIACDNTVAVAARFDETVLPRPKLRLPSYPIPSEFKSDLSYIRHLAREGSVKRFGETMPRPVADRLNTELKIINDQGFISYFLIVWDLVKWAREDGNLPDWPTIDNGILVGPGRGSAAGSVLSYVLEIVDIDPLENNLLFERFMEPGRKDMPDIDLDFELRYVDRVRAYLAWKWGKDKVARIGTHNVAQTKAAIKDAARVLDLPGIGARLTKVIPTGTGGKVFTFPQLEDQANGAAEKFRSELTAAGEDGARIVELAKKMCGTLKGEGIHACGILISTEPLRGLIPLRRDRSEAGSGGLNMVTAWDAPDVGDIDHDDEWGLGIGLLKLDVLSIRNLDIVAQACEFIEETTGEKIDPRRLPHPNTRGDKRVQATWSLLKAGRSAGVFQMDGAGMQNMSRAIGPESLTDLSAIVALFRPGPLSAQMDKLYAERKSGNSVVDYDQFTRDPAEQEAIASVLGETYGVWVFQEQLMRLGAVVSGFDAGLRSKLRKAVGKKNQTVMDQVSALFLEGATREFRNDDGEVTSIAFSKETAVRLIEAMQGSAAYLFNASHSAAYAQLAFVTAYLKANWPAEYGAAILATTSDGEKRLSAIEALTGEGINILSPDVNLSRKITAPDGDMTVRLGLSEIKKVGTLGDYVVDTREARGFRFDTLAELVRSLSEGNGSKTASIAGIEGLIEAGACDEFGPRLGQMMIVRAVKSKQTIAVPDAEFSVLEKSMRQRARLGLSVGEHPVSAYKQAILGYHRPGPTDAEGNPIGQKPIRIARIPAENYAEVYVAGLLAQWTEGAYSRGQKASIVLEGSTLRISGVMWDTELKSVLSVPPVGSIVALSAKVNMREREIEDEDGNVIETLVTKELSVKSVDIIEVDDSATGEAVRQLELSAASAPADLPDVPIMALLKLPPKKSSGRPNKENSKASSTRNASLPEAPVDEEPAPTELVEPEVIPFAEEPPATEFDVFDDMFGGFEAAVEPVREPQPEAVETPDDSEHLADQAAIDAILGAPAVPPAATKPAVEQRQQARPQAEFITATNSAWSRVPKVPRMVRA